MRRIAIRAVFFIISLFIASLAKGQGTVAAPQQGDFQSWNDFQITVPMSKQFDFFTKITMRLGKNVTRLNDGRYAVGFVWKPTKSLSFSPFFWYIRARNTAGQFRTENRLSLATSYKFPIKSVGLTHRSTFEYRERRPVSTWRYRAMMTVDKDIPEKIIPKAKFFVADEVFYDSATDKFSRNRFQIGITKTINKQWSVDIYYMRQNDHFTHPGDLSVIWTAWKLKL